MHNLFDIILYIKKTFLIFIIINLIIINAFSIVIHKENLSKGPLIGKNMYIPFFIYYNFTGLSAKSTNKYELNYHISFYFINDYKIERIINGNYIKKSRDYECLATEIGTSLNIRKELQLGIDIRFMSYYGGFLDPLIEGYHNIFGFPNGGREYSEQYQTNIDIHNDNNVHLYLDHPAFSFGDIDTWIKYTFFEKKWISLATLGALKIPTGRLSGISVNGSGYPDIATGLLADFRPVWFLTFYLQAGLVIPIDSVIKIFPSNPYPMFNGLVGIELNPLSFFSLIIQFNIKTSPIESEETNNYLFIGTQEYLSMPQTNLLVGIVFKYKKFRWQFYIEEDAFTNAGTDITFNLAFSQDIIFRRK